MALVVFCGNPKFIARFSFNFIVKVDVVFDEYQNVKVVTSKDWISVDNSYAVRKSEIFAYVEFVFLTQTIIHFKIRKTIIVLSLIIA